MARAKGPHREPTIVTSLTTIGAGRDGRLAVKCGLHDHSSARSDQLQRAHETFGPAGRVDDGVEAAFSRHRGVRTQTPQAQRSSDLYLVVVPAKHG